MPYIYGLVDPSTSEIRYVGYTAKSLEHRLNNHWCSRKRSSTHKNHWLCKLWNDNGIKPDIFVLEEVSEDEWEEAETFWIEYCRFIGANLTNGTIGGNGRKKGSRLSSEHKAKISDGLKKAIAAGTFKPDGSHARGKPAWNTGKKMPGTTKGGKTAKGVSRPWQDGEKRSEARRKDFVLVNRDTGERVAVSGIRKFCREYGLASHQNLSAVINGKMPSYKGWVLE